jgi:hypothetical protein
LSEESWGHACATAYTLQVDLFEESPWTEEVWTELLAGEPSTLLVHRVVANSGAAPWALKSPLYRQLIEDEAHHRPLAVALYNAVTNYFGRMDTDELVKMARVLRVSSGTLEARMVEDLWTRLGIGPEHGSGGSHGA